MRHWWPLSRTRQSPLWPGAAAALAVALPYQCLVLRPMLAMDIYLPLTTYLFWFGLPALLHVAAGVVGAQRLNRLPAAARARPAAAAGGTGV